MSLTRSCQGAHAASPPPGRHCLTIHTQYASLLHAGTRKALNLNLEGAVVVIDEAHNVVNALQSLHSAELRAGDAKRAHEQLERHLVHYGKQMKPERVTWLRQLKRVVKGLMISTSGAEGEVRVFTANGWLVDHKIESTPLPPLVAYMELARLTATAGREDRGPLMRIKAMIQALGRDDSDGRLLEWPATGELRFVMLSAATPFAQVVAQARAIVLAGGTLSPVDDMITDLVPSVPPSQVRRFACGHVIGPGQLMPMVVGGVGRLTFAERGSHSCMDSVGAHLLALATTVPRGKGTVVFLPSFKYGEKLLTRWRKSDVWDRLSERATLLSEPRSAGGVAATLHTYRQTLEGGASAILFAVVGGKMSEGINFEDDLARLVVVVGLPFPDRSEPVLAERLKHVARRAPVGKGEAAASDYLTNLCMRAVNQSIGRAIRNRTDWAALALLDARYSDPKVVSKIPDWISASLSVQQSLGAAVEALNSFFACRGNAPSVSVQI